MFLIRLKPEYDGVTITRSVIGLGEVTFSPSVREEYYDNYLKLGFDLFEIYDTKTEKFIKDADAEDIRFERFN